MRMLEWGIYLVVLCLPLYLVRFSVWGLPINVLEVLVGVLFVLWAMNQTRIKNYKSGIRKIEKFIIRNSSFIIPILLILVGATIATIFSWDLRLSAGIWKGWFIVPLIFFLILITTIKKPDQIRKIFYSLISSGFIISIISLIYLIQGNFDKQGRLQGVYNSPNSLAMYLAPIFIISFGYCFFTFLAAARGFARGLRTRKKTISKTILLIVNCLLLIVILFFTKSFGAWLGIIVAVCFGLGISLCRRRNKRLFFLIVVLGLLIILLLFIIKTSILPMGKSSFDARLVIWQRAWEAFKMSPVIGIGPGTFKYYFPPHPNWGVPQPHNLYLAFLLQTGIIGFIGFIWLLVWFFHPSSRQVGTSDDKLKLLLMMVMVYILIHGLVDTTYWKNDLSVVFWLVIALLSTITRFSYSQTSNNFLEEKEINQ